MADVKLSNEETFRMNNKLTIPELSLFQDNNLSLICNIPFIETLLCRITFTTMKKTDIILKSFPFK